MSDSSERVGSIGPAQIIFFVIAAAAPLTGTLGAIPIAIAAGNGAGAPLAFLTAGIVLLLFSVGFTRMTPHVTGGGAFYSYISKGLGRRLGVGAGMVAVLSYAAIQLALYGLFGFFCKVILPDGTSWHISWWIYAMGALLLTHFLGRRNVDLNATVLGVLMCAEIAVVILVVAGIIAHAPSNRLTLTVFSPERALTGSFGVSMMFALACFVGFEATAIYAREARDPARTVPAATYLSVIIIAVFFTLASWAIVCAYGVDGVKVEALTNPGNIWFSAARANVGDYVVTAMKVLLLSSIFASILAFHNALARYIQVMASDGLLWRALAPIDPGTGCPLRACTAQSVSAAVAIAGFTVFRVDPYAGLFGWMSSFATIGILLLQILVGCSVLRFFSQSTEYDLPVLPRVCALLSTAMLIAAMAVMIANLPTLAGGSGNMIFILPMIQLLLLLIGAAIRTASKGQP